MACDACRVKKCKCERQLPSCAQCTAAGLACIYAEAHRRGFPPGYIAALERRLLESELALFDALTTVQHGSSPTGSSFDPEQVTLLLVKRGTSQFKAASIKEWQQLPLTTPDHRRVWYQSKMSDFSQAADRDGTAVTRSLAPAPAPSSMAATIAAPIGEGGTDNSLWTMGRASAVDFPNSATQLPLPTTGTATANTMFRPGDTRAGNTPSLSPVQVSRHQEQPPQPQHRQFATRGGQADPVEMHGNAESTTSESHAQRLSSSQWRRFF